MEWFMISYESIMMNHWWSPHWSDLTWNINQNVTVLYNCNNSIIMHHSDSVSFIDTITSANSISSGSISN